jgi:hypothetical protein
MRVDKARTEAVRGFSSLDPTLMWAIVLSESLGNFAVDHEIIELA